MRLFAGIWPPPDAVAKLRQLERPDLAGVRWVVPAQWHVTVRFFGEVEAADVSGLIDRLSAVAARFREAPPIQASLGPRVGRLGPRILAVEVGGLGDLAAEIHRATIPLGASGPPDAGDHSGTGPLGGPASGEADQAVEAAVGGSGGERRPGRVPAGGQADSRSSDPDGSRPFLGHLTLARCRRGAKVGTVVGQPVSAEWAVEDLALIASELGPGGARYRDVIRLPLAPQLPRA